MSADSQSSIFLSGEGDAWFARNNNGLQENENYPEIDFICKTLKNFDDQIHRILEIGCGGGSKLEYLARKLNASGDGIDPSIDAINFANKRQSASEGNLRFHRGLATELPYDDGIFDLVFFGFCLYLIPPNEIFKAMAEANRVLKEGRFLAILDFDYGQLKTNPYKHSPGVVSYKNNYSHFFTTTGYFHQVSKWSFSHDKNSFTQEREERLSLEVLYKEVLDVDLL